MPTALIADDEEAPRAQLADALRRVWPALEIVQECANGVDAWDAFLEREPQVCFLDVRMPGLTGIDVAQRIRARAHVVFVAAAGDHALAAFADAGEVADHVLKPVDDERLARACERVRARLAAGEPPPAGLQALLNRLAGRQRKPAPLEAVEVGVGREARLLRVDEVLWFEADGRYTRVVHDGGDALLRTPLKELPAQLDPERFRQVSRTAIVNRRCIAGTLRADDGALLLALHGRDERLPVGRHFQDLFAAP